MEIIQVQQKGDVYTCDVDISKEEWLEILQDEKTLQAYKETLLRFYYMPEHRGSCVAVSKKMGGNAHALNLYVSKFGQYVKKRLNRFEIYGTDGNSSRWMVPMGKGRILSKDDEGSFEWELRPELVDAIQEYLYWFLVAQYKKLRHEIPIRDEKHGWDELYKWELITASEGKTPWEIVVASVDYPADTTKGGFKNLIYPTGYGKSMKYIVGQHPKEMQEVLLKLSDETEPLHHRLGGFKKSLEDLLPSKGYNSKANDERTAATILTCVNPEKYTFYKHDELYDRFCKYMGVDMQKAGACYEHYLCLLEPLAKIAENSADLQQIVKPMLEGQRQSRLLLAQDILWMLLREMNNRLGYIYDLLFNTKTMEANNTENLYIRLLKANHNLILTGAPGTGKTHLAKEIAADILGVVAEELESDKRFGFVQFHPSYDYTDFVEGLRPVNTDGNVGFELRNGVFKEFCSRALDKIFDEPKNKYVFIIDEINRGEISKIFGELFYSIDPGYRGEAGKVQTQYQNLIEEGDVFKEGFYVPENVYIIGTMNDIDRSVESMDFAMRRRFAWQEVTAEDSYANMIENDEEFVEVKDEIKQRMFSLNKAIAETEGLDEAYQIGAAYFRKYLDYQDKENPFECLWNNHLKGLLFEYLRGNRRAKELLEKLHKAYNKTNIDEQPAHTNEG